MIRTHYVGELNAQMDGAAVTVAGWVHEVRETAKITFLILRDKTGIAQVIGKKGTVPDGVIKSMSLPKESVVQVKGTVKANKEAKSGFEIVPTEITNLNPLSAAVPFEVTGKVPAEIDVRLNYRYIDLRRLETAAIFKIQSTILTAFRSALLGKDFQEIRTPSIIAEASEGGAELFSVQYFEKQAYLAQSPQLYKQLAVIGGIDRVFTITPIFRAEKSNTVFHLAESTQMDIEMGFADHNDAIGVLSDTFTSVITEVKKKNAAELALLEAELEVPKVRTITYEDALDALCKKGQKMKFGDDFTREHEVAICEIFGDAVIVKEYPTVLRAFYSMPKPDRPEVSNSFDLIYRGLELSSGAQRIHQPEMLIEALRKRKLNPDNFEFYINAFRCGAPPHAGWSVGLERFTMQVVGADNIRECSLFPRDRKRLNP